MITEIENVNSENPCDECLFRKMYAHVFDMHFFGEDCPKVNECEKYQNRIRREQ